MPRLIRRGTVTPLLVVSLTLFVAAFGLAVNAAWLWSVRVELQAAADAAALAGVQDLVTDGFLRGDTATAVGAAQGRAADYARRNVVRGHSLTLTADAIVVGTLDRPGGTFAAGGDPATANAVQVTAGEQAGVIFGQFLGRGAAAVRARALGYADRDVYGVRPLYGPAPLAPMALKSDTSAANPLAWETQVEAGSAPEFVAALPLRPDHLPAAGLALLYYGEPTAATVVRTFAGVTRPDLADLGGRLALNASGETVAPGQATGPAVGTPDLMQIVGALQHLQQLGAVRAWPLYTEASPSRVRVTGFVAARVTRVVPPVDENQPLVVAFQPAALVLPAALTDVSRRTAEKPRGNPYIAKPRLADR